MTTAVAVPELALTWPLRQPSGKARQGNKTKLQMPQLLAQTKQKNREQMARKDEWTRQTHRGKERVRQGEGQLGVNLMFD